MTGTELLYLVVLCAALVSGLILLGLGVRRMRALRLKVNGTQRTALYLMVAGTACAFLATVATLMAGITEALPGAGQWWPLRSSLTTTVVMTFATATVAWSAVAAGLSAGEQRDG